MSTFFVSKYKQHNSINLEAFLLHPLSFKTRNILISNFLIEDAGLNFNKNANTIH